MWTTITGAPYAIEELYANLPVVISVEVLTGVFFVLFFTLLKWFVDRFVHGELSGASFIFQQKERKAPGVFSEHGWGLSIIEAIAERHGGFLETEQQGERFHTMVAMELRA